jgi:hypothetical protein
MSTRMVLHLWAALLWEAPRHTLRAERHPEDALARRQTLMLAALGAGRRRILTLWLAPEGEHPLPDGQVEEERLPVGEAEAVRRLDLLMVMAGRRRVGLVLGWAEARRQIHMVMLVPLVGEHLHQTILIAGHQG